MYFTMLLGHQVASGQRQERHPTSYILLYILREGSETRCMQDASRKPVPCASRQ